MTLEGPGCEVVITRSGAHAMRDLTTGELMHPIVGPLVEAERLYVAPSRLEERLAKDGPGPLVLLDVGLGAGSNAAAAWKLSCGLAREHALARDSGRLSCRLVGERRLPPRRQLEIVSFDRTAAAMELALADEHAASFGFEGDALPAARGLVATGAHESAHSSWRLVLGELPATLAREPEGSADVVFWDPFSPRANPALWTMTAFVAVRRLCRTGATLHTYSAATATRSALLLAGFVVGAGSATSENKQTTIAAVSASDVERPLDPRWLDRLRRSSAPFPPDAPPDALARIAALRQFH